MTGTSTVLRRDLRELRRTNAFRILVLTFAVITIGIAVGASIALGRQEWLRAEAASPLLELIIGLIVYFLPLSVLISFIWSFALYYLAGAIVVWAVVCYLSRLLTREQIVLSSKGG